jgi:hypothetical protein
MLRADETEVILISKIGRHQVLDLIDSTGIVYFDDYARICTVIKEGSKDNRGDTSPHRMAKLFGGDWRKYNNHFIIQCSGCPMMCPYCYVDNLKIDKYMTVSEIVELFETFRFRAKATRGVDINVLHLMGGDPGLYCDMWPELRRELDKNGMKDVVLFSDVILVENKIISKKPWEFIDLERFLLVGCLKGTTRESFKKNSGLDLFNNATEELMNYLPYSNFYITLIAEEKPDKFIYEMVSRERIDHLKIVNYKAIKFNRYHERKSKS